MFEIGFWELIMVGVVALIVVGPERLPGLARTAGLWLGKARRMIADVKAEVDRELHLEEIKQTLRQQANLGEVKDLTDQVKSLRQDIQAEFDDPGPPPGWQPGLSSAPPPPGWMPPGDTPEPLPGVPARLLRIVIGILAVFVAMSPFSNPIYTALAGPLTRHMPAQSSMIAIDVLSPFLTPLKFTLVLAVFVTVPWTLYQVWAFVAPGLYQREKRMVLPILASSTLLFYCGMAFAYFVIMPIFFAFITSTAPEGVAVMTDINRYLDFVMTIFLAFGVAFEVPVATVILALAGILSPEAMAAKRPFVIVGAFVVGMLLTPPDVISQTLLALPMWLLFEIGVFISRLLLRRRGEARATAAATESTRQR